MSNYRYNYLPLNVTRERPDMQARSVKILLRFAIEGVGAEIAHSN